MCSRRLLPLLLLLLGTFTVGTSETQSIHSLQRRETPLSRVRRNVVDVSVQENLATDVTVDNTIYDLRDQNEATPVESYSFLIEAVTDSVSLAIFLIEDYKLKLNRGAPSSDLDAFDRETNPVIAVEIKATETSTAQTVSITVNIQLIDVNDESPVFLNPAPYQAVVAVDAPAGTVVYTATALDQDLSSQLEFYLDGTGDPRFAMGTVTDNEATIVTVGSEPFVQGTIHTVRLAVNDKEGNDPTAKATIDIQILVGTLPPQFYSERYEGQLYEGASPQPVLVKGEANSLVIQVIQFQPVNSLTFSVNNPTFDVLSVDGETDRITLESRQAIDYEQTKSFTVVVSAVESNTDYTSSATVEIAIIDENDSSPTFVGGGPQFTEEISENPSPGATVFSVSATDEDSEENGEIEFSISGTDVFDVKTERLSSGSEIYVGHVVVTGVIDYEQTKEIEFDIIASDGARSTSVSAIVNIINVNDNAPVIDSSVQVALPADITIPYVVTILAASDQDAGDGIQFSFASDSDYTSYFNIDDQSGSISLMNAVPTDQDVFELKVVTTDDGECCVGTETQTSTTTVTVIVEDANNNKPDFTTCADYNDAEVLEYATAGTEVVQVSATDDDRGDNARVTYSLSDENSPFEIDADSGWITVKSNSIDRGDGSYIAVTVIGSNSYSTQPLTGYCSFRVNVVDINNHAPRFSKSEYVFEYLYSIGAPWTIGYVVAADEDFGENANIIYSLENVPPDVSGAFTILELTGALQISTLDGITPGVYSMTVVANDNGSPTPLTGSTIARVTVTEGDITLPSWIGVSDYTYTMDLSEGTALNTVFESLQCRSNDASDLEVEFHVFESDETINDVSEYFVGTRVAPVAGSDVYTLDISLVKQLDYLNQKTHSITATCQGFNSGNLRAPDIVIEINVLDTNNQAPMLQGMSIDSGRFSASVPENSPIGTSVRTVTVIDEDTNSAFKQISFSLIDSDASLFRIDKISDFSATVFTEAEFNREEKDDYRFTIVASDGENSDDQTMVVEITDVNDMAPVFANSSYTFSVSENAEINDVIGLVTATDEDLIDQGQLLEYQFTSGNENSDDSGVFTILFGTGEIRLARKVDYDSQKTVYALRLEAYDDNRVHTATTSVTIEVTDENDQPPVFEPREYEVKDLVEEEDETITPDNPRLLVTVKAVDNEQRPETSITYDLVAPSTLFTVDSVTGEVYLIGTLDRDGSVPETRVTIRAADEPNNDPLYAYADVVVYPIDINDNAPVFEACCINFNVTEHSPRLTYVGTVLARDIDSEANAKVSYYLNQDQQTSERANFFSLGVNGMIETNVDADDLDYELFTTVELQVEARDGGTPPNSRFQTVIITLDDANDQAPFFDQNLYSTRMSEATTSGEILRVLARDDDTDPENRRLQFSIVPPEQHFLVDSDNDYAIISVNSEDPIDYETDERFYEFVLAVTDGAVGHTASTTIQVTVEDFNDNAPVFDPDRIALTLVEGEDKGETIATFSATDIDDGINAQFEYMVDPASDPYFEFYADPENGQVITRKVLDRELADTRNVIIWAIDKGEIPLTGSATLELTLTDINDNAPTFAEDYLPVIPENEDFTNEAVVEIFATDPDTRQYGPPFGFELPPGCDACDFFSLQYNPTRDGNNGTATIFTSSRFDREVQKEYHLPIIMWDMSENNLPTAGSQSATNTLTIIIGDKNDNQHSPGYQAITFNNFDGQFGDVVIGRVYAADADDWDLPDKTFTYVSPELYATYFTVDRETGEITIKKGVSSNAGGDPYTFEVDVFDKIFGNTERCEVAVTVKDLPDEALRKAGSVRLAGITSDEFIVPGGASVPDTDIPASKMDLFREEMARILQYPSKENIEVVSLNDGPGYLDVRFAGHASPYVTAAQMESALMLNMDSVESKAGISVSQVPINLCMEEKYHIGCYTELDVSGEPQVINANGTSLTTMAVSLRAVDGCPDYEFPTPQECRGDYCYNGGTCVQDDWGNLSCDCPSGYSGPRCQQRRHSFDGNSGTFYRGLSACAEGRTSIEFITENLNGLIMFSGPIVEINPDEMPQDYLVLELKNGYPELRINLGVGELKLTLENDQGQILLPQLSDGEWHRLDIDRDSQDVTLTVDHCDFATSDANGAVADWSPCRVHGRVPGGDVLLNSYSLLQLGRRYPVSSPPPFPSDVTTQGFNGCMRNLFHNSLLYDLYYRPILNWDSGSNGCPKEEGICGEDTNSPECGQRSSCQSSWGPDRILACTCEPGWYGNQCSSEAPEMDLRDNSYFHWEVSTSLLEAAERMVSLQLMFRSRQETGTLFAMTNAAQNKIDLQLVDSKLLLRYNLGEGEQTLMLNDTTAANGNWHVARVERHGNEFQLTMDGGEGRMYNYQPIKEDESVLFLALSYITAGARVPTVEVPSESQISYDLVDSCLRDVRFNGGWLPMREEQNSLTEPGLSLLQARNTLEGCTREDCVGVDCEVTRYCVPLWGMYECRCVDGYQEDAAGVCVSSCTPNPCFNNVPCSLDNGAVVCACPDGFTGQFCNVGVISDGGDDGLSGGAIAGIVIAIIVLLVLIILLVLFLLTCRKEDNEKNVLEVDPDDDFIRENVMYYDEEGAGEEDHEAYDITLLQKMNSEVPDQPDVNPVKEEDIHIRNEPRLDRPDVGSFIDSRIRDTENDDDPFRDVPQEFNYEGGNSDAGSLSSLNTSSSGASQDYDYLNDWGPKFARLADMYGAGQNLDS